MRNVWIGGTALILALGTSSGQQTFPVDLAQAFAESKPLIVMLEVDWAPTEQPSYGAGIIVGYDANYLYAVTASHVIWKGTTPAGGVRAYLQVPTGRVVTATAETLTAHDPPYNGNQRGLDLATFRISRASYGGNPDSLPFRIQGDPRQLRSQEQVYAVGYPGGQNKWYLSPKPDQYLNANGSFLVFHSDVVAEGYSGGPLFNSRFQLIGMTSRDAPPSGESLGIDALRTALAQWGIPCGLSAGAGHVIVSDADRAAYALTDASASISIRLPTDQPSLGQYVSQLQADIAAFGQQNPRYNNERPREMYYAGYTDPPGRPRTPSTVSIYTDSPYWPAFNRFPVAFLITRIQTTGLYFYRRAISPQAFDPDRPAADLALKVSINWVKYGAVDRQIAAENNWGRLEVQYSTARGVALTLFGWNLRSPKDTWQSNGSISSLLDLRGAQLIVATTVGNLSGQNQLQREFDSVHSASLLDYANLAFGNRSLHLDASNTSRYVDKYGNPYYVFTFPGTSEKLLRTFTRF